eukprot:1294145-Pleurochrysis_carterae.AAC.1
MRLSSAGIRINEGRAQRRQLRKESPAPARTDDEGGDAKTCTITEWLAAYYPRHVLIRLTHPCATTRAAMPWPRACSASSW